MQSNRSFRLLVGLLVFGLIVISLGAGLAYVDWDNTNGPYTVPREHLDDPPAVTQLLSDRAGFSVRWPEGLPADVRLVRARVVAAFDPVTATHPEGEWWSELHWEKERGIELEGAHPWVSLVLTQGRDLPIPDRAVEFTLPMSGIAARMTTSEDQVSENATVWVSSAGMDYAISVRSLAPLPDEDLERVLQSLLD